MVVDNTEAGREERRRVEDDEQRRRNEQRHREDTVSGVLFLLSYPLNFLFLRFIIVPLMKADARSDQLPDGHFAILAIAMVFSPITLPFGIVIGLFVLICYLLVQGAKLIF